ncbi:MAG: ribonuclease H family protein [Fusobacteriaceae bacterium]|jgi:ribonuclease HI|nr:ribonuclease H family protein [Fusobacteriaceae bacterium]
MKKKVYGYFLENENISGITHSWEECKSFIEGKKSRYKSFDDIKDCELWLANGAKYEKKPKKEDIYKTLPDGIYFDAGTGRGNGVEVRVTNNFGISYIKENFHSFQRNEFNNIILEHNKTNNFGELLGLTIALSFAKKENIKNIYGDSYLVIKYWSKGFYNSENLDEDTIKLIKYATTARAQFETNGGQIAHISGDINPADIGFHR